jgi:hypothetical protein
MMPSDGISLTTAHEFLNVGVFALGIGADLVDTNAVPEGLTVHVIQRRGVSVYRSRIPPRPLITVYFDREPQQI